jgi:L-ascorbate metabolism protein UlaG (beta-lactamase superfamily)
MLAWKLGRRRDPRPDNFAELDAVRPAVIEGAAAALAGPGPRACWVGHASWLLRTGGALIAIDPIFATAISGVIKRLTPPGVEPEELPPLDLVLITHDHRDHMDVPSLERIGTRPTCIVPLGNGPRLAALGFDKVIELDWWQRCTFGGVEIEMVPARHWSMRAPWNRNDTLWGGYVIRSADGVAYHSGDTAWGEHFAEIGQRVGPIDWAMLPIGGYAPRWFMEPQHIDPIEAGRACLDLGARHLLAMHWGTYRLTDEAIGEPPARLRAWWRDQALDPARLWILDAGETRALTRP